MHGITTNRTDGGVRTIALDRPEKLNALDTATLRNLASTVADADEQVVVVEGGVVRSVRGLTSRKQVKTARTSTPTRT